MARRDEHVWETLFQYGLEPRFMGRVAIAVEQKDCRRLDFKPFQLVGYTMDRRLIEWDVDLAIGE